MTDKRIARRFRRRSTCRRSWRRIRRQGVLPLDPGLSFPEQPQWQQPGRAASYNQKNPGESEEAPAGGGLHRSARALDHDEGIPVMYRTRSVAQAATEAVGFKIELQVSRRATLVQRRNSPSCSTLLDGHHVQPRARVRHRRGVQLAGLVVARGEKGEADGSARRESDPRKRKAIWERVQQIFYEDVGRIKFGDEFRARRLPLRQLRGFRPRPTRRTSGTSGSVSGGNPAAGRDDLRSSAGSLGARVPGAECARHDSFVTDPPGARRSAPRSSPDRRPRARRQAPRAPAAWLGTLRSGCSSGAGTCSLPRADLGQSIFLRGKPCHRRRSSIRVRATLPAHALRRRSFATKISSGVPAGVSTGSR